MSEVSVIIPNYNHAQYLKQRIDSVLNQTYKKIEVIILDDCSTDNGKEIIEQYRTNNKVKEIIYNSENSGNTFQQWKKGLSLANGEYVWIAESDDFCDTDFLEKTVAVLDRNSDAVLAYANTISVDKNGEDIGDLSFWYDDLSKTKWKKSHTAAGNKEIKKYLSVKNTIPNASAVVFRRSALRNFDERMLSFKVCGDWFFWIQLIKDKKLIYLFNTKNYFRTHAGSVRSSKGDTAQMNKEILIIHQSIIDGGLYTKEELNLYLKNYDRPSLFKTSTQQIRKIIGAVKRKIKA